MSWFLGGIGHFDEEFLKSLPRSIPSPLMHTRSDNLFLFAGGISGTCKFNIDNPTRKKRWLQVGIGIKEKTPRKFLTDEDWDQIVTDGKEGRAVIDGHYLLISWDSDRITFVTDRAGLRDFYYCIDPGGNIIFSTRIDWLARLVQTGIKFEEFGSRWLLFNQISSGSILKNIKRVVRGMDLAIDLRTKRLFENKTNWLPSAGNYLFSEREFSEELEDLITFPLNENKLSLSLSGGLDSRVLFSYLLKKKGNWDSHTFGREDHPDAVRARQMADDFDIEHTQIEIPPPSPDGFLGELKEYAGQSVINNCASSYLQLRNYRGIEPETGILIDGGFGEIWRREFFNRLLVLGSKYILAPDLGKLIPHLSLHRADIFSGEVKKIMYAGCKDQLGAVFSELPSAGKIGVENWIDLFAVRTRITNYYSHEQSRYDSSFMSQMPFLQPSLLDKLPGVPLNRRKNGKMFREFIKINEGGLAKYPLVKGTMEVPFRMNTLQSRIWNLVRKNLSPKSRRPFLRENAFVGMTPLLLDLINSKSVKECAYYDSRKINALADYLYKTSFDWRISNELDWWLIFELFRRQTEITNGK